MQEDFNDLLKAHFPLMEVKEGKIIIPQEFESFEACMNYSCLLQNSASEMIVADEKNNYMAERLLIESMKLNDVIVNACVILDKLQKQWT